MARPKGASASNTKRRLVEAGCQQFASLGLEGASLRQVAKAAEVSLATIHHYFGNKEALYQSCLASTRATLADELAPLVSVLGEVDAQLASNDTLDSSFAETVDRWVCEGFAIARRQQRGMRLLMRGLLGDGELDPTWRDQTLVPFLHRSSEVLAVIQNRPARDLLLEIHEIIILIMRYSLSSAHEIMAVTGTVSVDEGISVIEGRLVAKARAIIEIPGARGTS